MSERLDDFVEWNEISEDSLNVDDGVSVDKAKLYRLKKWQDDSEVMDKGSRNLNFAFVLIKKYCGALGVPKCVYDKSVSVYGDSVDEGLLRGRRVEVLVATSIYVACRLCHVGYSVDEIVECVGVGKKEVTKLFRSVRKGLGLKLPLVKSKDYVVRFSSVLNLSDDVTNRVIEILELADDEGLSNGRSPLGLVGGAVYLAGLEFGDKRSQRDVGDVIGVSEVTIRKRCVELEEMISL